MTRFTRLLIVLVFALKFGVVVACAKDIHVSTPQALLHALINAKGGEKLILEPGHYGSLSLDGRNNTLFQYASPVTLISRFSENRSTFQKIRLNGVRNLIFDQLLFDYEFTNGDPVYAKTFSVVASDSISILNSIFDGDNASGTHTPADGFGTGIGLNVGKSSQIKIEGNTFFTWHRGATFGRISGLKVSKNELYSIRSDGLNFVAVNDVIIEGNYIHDFRRSLSAGDHADMIQFWTAKSMFPTTSVLIRGNILDVGKGDPTQSIFMRNEVVDQSLAGREMYYKNIVINGNVIRNGHFHAITVGETEDLSVEANTIVQLRSYKGEVAIPSINVSKKSTSVKVIGNVTPRLGAALTMKRLGWEVGPNFVTQLDSPNLANSYRGIFVNAEAGKNQGEIDLRFLPDSEPARLGLGSPLSRFDDHPITLDGYIQNHAETPDDRRQAFSAAQIYGPTGKIDTINAEATWNFGDGSTGKGISVEHTYVESGEYFVKVNIELANGREIGLSRMVVVGKNP